MASPNRLNKALWSSITRLKLLAESDDSNKFILEQSPFDGIDEVEAATALDEYVVIGRILPESQIYKESAFRIEMKLTSQYPKDPPTVRFLTPVYHPNIEADGKLIQDQKDQISKRIFIVLGTFCSHLLARTSRWKTETTLDHIIKAVIKHLDEPDPDYAVTYGKKFLFKDLSFFSFCFIL